jgi:hypothetical protein
MGHGWKDGMKSHIDGIKWIYSLGYGTRLVFMAHRAHFPILQPGVWLDIYFLIVKDFTHGSRQEGAS